MASISALNHQTLNYLKEGRLLLVDSMEQKLRPATWGEYMVRWINWSAASSQDQESAEWLIRYLNEAQGCDHYSKSVDAVAKFVKACRRSDGAFKRLENTVFAHKCRSQIPSLQVDELIDAQGHPLHALLAFLKSNSLHYVIGKVSPEHKETAILVKENQEIFIRSKNGEDFLNSSADVALILQKLPNDHADFPLLSELQQLLADEDLQDDSRIGEIHELLDLSHYKYVSLGDVKRDQKGMLVSQAYLADGIEDFEHSKWEDLKPNFREASDKQCYQMRIITRLPAYALEETWLGTIKTIMLNIFDFRAHGHSWVELTEPVKDGNGDFADQQNVYNVGYYFHPLDRYKRFESADPMSFMPIPSNQLVVEEIELTPDQYQKAHLYIREVQQLVSNPNRTLDDETENQDLSEEEKEDIQYLFKSTLKSTCLSFANTLKEVVTGIETDNRGALRQWLIPKRGYKRWDRIDAFVERTIVLRWLVNIPRFFGRMELPFWVKSNSQKP